MQRDNAAKVTHFELEEHRRGGRFKFMPERPECREGAIRQRPHRRQVDGDRPGGELSIDVSGPHVPGRFPTDASGAWPRRAQYMLIASYRVFNQGGPRRTWATRSLPSSVLPACRAVHRATPPRVGSAGCSVPAHGDEEAQNQDHQGVGQTHYKQTVQSTTADPPTWPGVGQTHRKQPPF
mgnify:CR=1 FL=1